MRKDGHRRRVRAASSFLSLSGLILRRIYPLLILTLALNSALASVAFAATSEPPAPPTKDGQGLQFGRAIDDHGQILLTDQVAKLIADSGARWIRINFRLGSHFPDWTTPVGGVTALNVYDQVVQHAQHYGLQVLGVLSNEAWLGSQSQWQENNAEVAGGGGINPYIQGFAQKAAVVLAQHFKGRVDWWQVWNEPNINPTFIYPSNFAQLLAQVYTGVKAAGVTTARFISGGIQCGNDSDGAITADSCGANYLKQTYAQGRNLADWERIKTNYGSYPFDGLGEHIYLDQSRRTTSSRIGTTLQLLHDAQVMAEGSALGKQTYITESGWSTSLVSEQVQAANLQTEYDVFQSTSYVQTAFWFFLRDEPGANLYYGLLRPDSSKKPAWTAYQQYATY